MDFMGKVKTIITPKFYSPSVCLICGRDILPGDRTLPLAYVPCDANNYRKSKDGKEYQTKLELVHYACGRPDEIR